MEDLQQDFVRKDCDSDGDDLDTKALSSGYVSSGSSDLRTATKGKYNGSYRIMPNYQYKPYSAAY